MLERQIRPGVFARAMAGVELVPEALERQAAQTEFTLPIWEYLDIAASDERIRGGRQALRKHRFLFNRIERSFGVEPEVIAAIWGLETGFGVIRGDIPVIATLATLAFAGHRAQYFENELVAALRMVQSGTFAPRAMVGSWAGAMGHGQFMPSAVRDFAVDFDADGRPDLLASIANYLKKHGWKRGQPWGLELRLPADFDFGFSGTDQSLASRDWAAMGLVAADGAPLPDYGPGSVLLPAGASGVALLALTNFHVIRRYNRSDAYAVGIGHLSDRIASGRPFSGNWPVQDRMLASDEIAELQQRLTASGFETGDCDGIVGPNTTRALRAWQMARGLVADAYPSVEALTALRSETG